MNEISNKLYTIDLFSNKLVSLIESEKIFFNQVKNTLNSLKEENKLLLVYRGEKKSELRDKLYFKNNDDLYFKFFHLGDKSKYLIKSNSFTRYIKDINDVSLEVFEKIFDVISVMSTQGEVMTEYFSEPENRELFLNKINTLDDKIKLRIRDYYFSYLHVKFQDSNRSSIFLSTSKSIETANEFAGNRNNKIVIYYYISKPYVDLAIYCKNEPHLKKHCKDNDLPIYEVKNTEEEVSVKIGLLPHYIIGVSTYIDGDEAFVVNPYLFCLPKDLKELLLDGFPVDQKDFHEILKDTNWNGIMRYEDNSFEEIEVD